MARHFLTQRGNTGLTEQRAYRFVGHPDADQEQKLRQFIGAARFLWNRMLADWITSFEEKGKSDPVKTPAAYKKESGLEWLNDMDSLCLANVQLRFIQAINGFFDGEINYPKFKKKHSCKDAYTTNLANRENPNLFLDGCLLKLPKIKNPIKLRLHRQIRPGGILKNCTVTHEPNGKWYFSLVFEYPKIEISKTADEKDHSKIQAIGLDMSLPELYVDSDGNTPLYPKPYRKIAAKIAREQHRLSLMEPDSNNYKKQKIRIAKLHAKAKHQRADFLHKQSYALTTQYDLICIEDLDMAAIKKTLFFGKSASDNGWGMFTRMLDYKADWYGCTIIRTDRWFPSSKTCCACGHVHKELKLSDRQYVCPECGHVMARDHQAAVNILNEGMRLYLKNCSEAA